jgi:hypothetical protein
MPPSLEVSNDGPTTRSASERERVGLDRQVDLRGGPAARSLSTVTSS